LDTNSADPAVRITTRRDEMKENDDDQSRPLNPSVSSSPDQAAPTTEQLCSEDEYSLNYDNPDVLRCGLIHLRHRIDDNLDAPHYRDYHLGVIDAALSLVGSATDSTAERADTPGRSASAQDKILQYDAPIQQARDEIVTEALEMVRLRRYDLPGSIPTIVRLKQHIEALILAVQQSHASPHETGWLVELTGKQRYWTGLGNGDISFYADHRRALRFARRQDAEHARDMFLLKKMVPLVSVVQHSWESTVQQSHASQIQALQQENERLKKDHYAEQVLLASMAGESVMQAQGYSVINLAHLIAERAAKAEAQIVALEQQLSEKDTTISRAVPTEADRLADLWRPIESAPKDGTLLLWIPGRVPHVAVGAFWQVDDYGWGWWAGPSLVEPSHWQPLPPPPGTVPALSDSLTGASEDHASDGTDARVESPELGRAASTDPLASSLQSTVLTFGVYVPTSVQIICPDCGGGADHPCECTPCRPGTSIGSATDSTKRSERLNGQERSAEEKHTHQSSDLSFKDQILQAAYTVFDAAEHHELESIALAAASCALRLAKERNEALSEVESLDFDALLAEIETPDDTHLNDPGPQGLCWVLDRRTSPGAHCLYKAHHPGKHSWEGPLPRG
jgi:hypothetical protein